MSKKTQNDISFDEAIKQLEEVVKQLESGQLTLEKSVELYQQGMELSLLCDTKLKQAELKIEVVTQSSDNLLKQPFETGSGKEDAKRVPH
jgi:exodeoxyribonuclease VII small subunit